MNKRIILLAVLLFAVAMPALADKPAKPAGMAKFIVFLKHAPPVPPGQTPKKIVPPDVETLGGVVLQSRDDYRVVYLPFAAAKQLRENENVDYLQRVWMGETEEEWKATEAPEEPPASLMRLRTNTLTETASWGPKQYAYDGSGNIKTIGAETYRYDAVSRLTQAVVNGVTETYTYDAFGNLTQKQTGSKPPVSMPAEMSSNRVAMLTYDIAGNVTSDPSKRYGYYAYDSMGMLVAMQAVGGRKRMYYTADDERIGFSLDNSLSRWTVRDFEGRPLREFRANSPVSYLGDAEWIWTEDYVYAGGQLVAGETAGPFGVSSASIAPDRRRRHFHLDHLGSVRLITADSDAAALGVHDYYPFGAEQTSLAQEEQNFGGSALIRPEPLRFTGHERDFNGLWNADNEDYLDYMHARYYDPFEGRFLSVDPKMRLDATETPQQWNRYSYTRNNPVMLMDPDGRDERVSWLYRRYGSTLDHAQNASAAAQQIPILSPSVAARDGADLQLGPFHARLGGEVRLKTDAQGNTKLAVQAGLAFGEGAAQVGPNLSASLVTSDHGRLLPNGLKPDVQLSAGVRTVDKVVSGKVNLKQVSTTISVGIFGFEVGVNYGAIAEMAKEAAAAARDAVDDTKEVVRDVVNCVGTNQPCSR